MWFQDAVLALGRAMQVPERNSPENHKKAKGDAKGSGGSEDGKRGLSPNGHPFSRQQVNWIKEGVGASIEAFGVAVEKRVDRVEKKAAETNAQVDALAQQVAALQAKVADYENLTAELETFKGFCKMGTPAVSQRQRSSWNRMSLVQLS